LINHQEQMLILDILLNDYTHSFCYSFILIPACTLTISSAFIHKWGCFEFSEVTHTTRRTRNCLPRQTGNWICSWGRPWILQGGIWTDGKRGILLLLFLNCLHSVKFRKFPAVGYKKMTKFLEKNNA